MYSRLLDLRPLPLLLSSAPSEEEEEESFGSHPDQQEAQEDEYSSSEENGSFLPHHGSSSKQRSSSSRRSSSSNPKKRKNHRSEPSDDETVSSRRPLASSVHVNRQAQRLNNHPMAGRSTNNSKGSKRTVAAADQEDATAKENEALKLQLHRLTKRMKVERTGKKKKAKSGTESAMEREVRKTTKQDLWKICKFIKSEAKLGKATKFVMEKLTLSEFEGLTGASLIDAQEIWKANYKAEVRQALNKQRNYAQQELRELMEEVVFAKNQEHLYPNEEEILVLCMRDKLDSKTPKEERERFETLFDNYWNVLLPKVSGHWAWGPTKRHYGLLSEMTIEDTDRDGVPRVSASDEAFLVLLWLNCFQKWWHREECRRMTPSEDPDEDHARYQTPYTDAKGGQMKFGGWNSEGVKKYEELLTMIKENRETQKKYVHQIEELALKRIRKVEKVEEKEASRKTKKKANSKKEEPDEDATDDENDYDAW